MEMGEVLGSKTSHSVAPTALGKFVPFARLGQGGMADVFLAVARGPVGFNKLVVVKRLRNTDDAMHVDMFLDEARLSARLSHANIVNTYEVGEVKGQYFIAMEYLEGQPLQSFLTTRGRRGERLDEPMAAFIAMQALKGLHYAHELADFDGTPLQIVHRDVSPHNLFLTYQGEIKLLDFGIAKAQVNIARTETGVLKGKVRYMSPEQMNDLPVDRRADVYALGVVLWEALAGQPLYQGDVASILKRVTSEGPPPVSSARKDVSPELEAIVARALRRDLDERYPDADAMRADLERFLRGKADGADATLARLVNDTFAETRDAVRARIKAFVADMPASPSGVHSTPDLAEAADLLPTLFSEGSGGSGGRPKSDDANAPPSSRVYVPTPSATLQRPSRAPARGNGAWWLLAAVVVVSVGGFFGLRRLQSPAEASPAAASQAPAAPAPTTATVHVEASPAGARVEWRGQPMGQVPLDVTLPAGQETLTVSLDGYEPQTLTLDVQAGRPAARAVVLRARIEPGASASSSAQPPPRTTLPPRWAPPTTTATPTPTASTPRPKIRVVDDDVTP